jgi:hypothetical protein
VVLIPKLSPVRDAKWMIALRDYPSVLTGLRGPTVVGMHLGSLGTGIKRCDSQALPGEQHYHKLGHDKGEITMLREHVLDDVLRDALRLYAENMYRLWKDERG